MWSVLQGKSSKWMLYVTSLYVVMVTSVCCYETLVMSQCHAMCLEEFYKDDLQNDDFKVRTQTLKAVSRKGSKYLDDCQTDSTCSQCVKPCSHTNLSLEDCRALCQPTQLTCNNTCTRLRWFLDNERRFLDNEWESCPTTGIRRQAKHACENKCQLDEDCGGKEEKCCPGRGRCGRMCQKVVRVSRNLVPKPSSLNAVERHHGNAMYLTWILPTNQSQVTIYVVEARRTLDSTPAWTMESDWIAIAKTAKRGVMVRDMRAGHWYQFRVASVGANGTRGFGGASQSFRSSRDVQPPRAPERLSEDGYTVHDGKVDVTLIWSRPISDLPIVKYTVYWSRRLDKISPTLVSLRVHKKRVSPAQTSCVLENLSPDTNYHIQVEAVARHDKVRLRSKRSSMLIRTYTIPGVSPVRGISTRLGHLSPGTHNLISIHKLFIDEPYYFNGVVNALVKWIVRTKNHRDIDKYMLRWGAGQECQETTYDLGVDSKIMAATTHQNKFIIYDLVYGCVYTIKAQVVNDDGRVGPVYQTTFTVPICSDILMRGHTAPICPADNPPPRVKHVEYNLYITWPNITAILRWKLPEPSPATSKVSGYRIEWGEKFVGRSYRSKWHHPVSRITPINEETMQTRFVSKHVERLELSGLHTMTDYVVYVRAVSHGNDGPLTYVEFSTPDVTHTIPPPDINKFIEEGSRYKEQAFESRDDLHGYKNMAMSRTSVIPSQVILEVTTTVTSSSTRPRGALTYMTVLLVCVHELVCLSARLR